MNKLSDIIKINTRLCRSININQDLGNAVKVILREIYRLTLKNKKDLKS